MANTFDQLNDALFAQMDKLQSIDPANKDAMEQCIEQSRTVCQLASNIIGNANAASNMVKTYESIGVDMGNIASRMPRMLGGKE